MIGSPNRARASAVRRRSEASSFSQSVIDERRIATQRITGVDERLRLVATIIDPPCYFADSTNSIALKEPGTYSLEYLLALLNSKLFQWRFKLTSTNNNVGTNELLGMPFRVLNFSLAADRALHDEVVDVVNRLLQMKRRQSTESLDREIAHTEEVANRLVFRLYDVSDQEADMVEEFLKRRKSSG